jgi:hypothetical protein
MEADGSTIDMECMLTFIAQLDPKGWIWKKFGYQQDMLRQILMHIVDLRDYIDEERFVQVSLESASTTLTEDTIKVIETKSEESIATVPPPTLNPSMWLEPDASTFRLRSKTYNQDKFKCNSAPALFKLVAVDVFEVCTVFVLQYIHVSLIYSLIIIVIIIICL